MNARALPPEWMELAEHKGIPQSARAIAEKAGIATTTLTRLIFEGRTSSETVRRVAKALDVPQDDIVALAGIKTKFGFWEPPREAHEMDGPTREAISNLIRVITKGVHGVADQDQKSDDDPDDGGVASVGGPGPETPPAPVRQLRPGRKPIPQLQQEAARNEVNDR